MVEHDLDEQHARLLINSLPRIGPQRYQQLLASFGCAQAALQATTAEWAALGIPQDTLQARHSPALAAAAERTLRWAVAASCHLLFHDSDAYPPLLSETAGAPPILFVEGNVQLLQQPQLAIIGSRHCSPAGEQLAHEFAKVMAASGCCVTSGLALGIDSAAHWGALAGKGGTLAVMGTGLLRTYPRRNQRLRDEIISNGGALVSELPLESGPHASHFPRRNRIISGLSLGVLVVEAGVASGSLITARYAAEQGRDVFAIPGSIHYPGSKGCHQLIREGAILVETVQDVLEEWQHWQLTGPEPETPATQNTSGHPLLELLKTRPLHTEELAAMLTLEVADLLVALTELEMDGHISQQAGQWFYLGT